MIKSFNPDAAETTQCIVVYQRNGFTANNSIILSLSRRGRGTIAPHTHIHTERLDGFGELTNSLLVTQEMRWQTPPEHIRSLIL